MLAQEKLTVATPKNGKRREGGDKPKAAPPKTPPKATPEEAAPKTTAKATAEAATPKGPGPTPAQQPAAPAMIPEEEHNVGVVLFLPSRRVMEACAKLQRRFRLVGLKQLALPTGLGAPDAAPTVLATAWDLSCLASTASALAALQMLIGSPLQRPGSILADFGSDCALGPFTARTRRSSERRAAHQCTMVQCASTS